MTRSVEPRRAKRCRVLVVDDAIGARRAIANALAGAADLEVGRPATSGELALRRLAEDLPDVVLLDDELPGMPGLDVLAAIRSRWPALPVVVFGERTAPGSPAAQQAEQRGACRCLGKPAGLTLGSDLPPALGIELVGALRAAVTGSTAAPGNDLAARPDAGPGFAVVVIGVSTGGPDALLRVIPALPADFPVPILVVQHMPPMFTRLLAERLDTRSSLTVREAVDGAVPAAGQVWIAPGDWHLEVARNDAAARLVLHRNPPENSCRPAVDPLFRAAAAVWRQRTLAVVLTGMGQDGLRGAESIVQAGGSVLAQDEASSVVWGMPGYVAAAGLAERVLPLEEIAPTLDRMVRAPRVARQRQVRT
jgi:two-component system chemotaxis response regulator CheB